ncbi:MAG: 2-oxoacid:acceptor oxidoreductase subunit alpha [candidate division KSB1 bacterium]|nr:2-oxoacid:acceptor oxidoreductase subunit alpha [candidate division KSB1 bacterium]MDZ7273662.1 2-oxoacid:acceptor oxidoreductase subunit alpha [candidate division KSB1 bacterium]MDZ7285818.1 2-oxoacid:acceptor oxidoreductase subunit alpha [candidate division KSB1 bacterium]MDZ7298850.1 2-oxoacid:acceptor oxidoreductase subunit alpha [candidate division KSB1 bacterium]MDZ7308571.1 2-oxoacid:acceptor oxidoreductase subunit alpha [candidate division KSB1 bacterium]
MHEEDSTFAIVGSGGEGVVSAGEILIHATARDGLYSMMVKSYGPQIRGGESLAQIRLRKTPVLCQGDALDAMVVLSWSNFHRFAGEVRLGARGIIMHDSEDAPPPNLKVPDKVRFVAVPFAATSKQITGGAQAKNLVALGFLAGWFDLPQHGFAEAIRTRFAKKGGAVQQSNFSAFQAGVMLAQAETTRRRYNWTVSNHEAKLVLTGNDAVALGSLFAGVKFFAGYPITPASEIMEWMARELPRFDRVFVQTEDEIAAVTMAIGASFAGVKAMTATSGPGLSLMTEAIGLAAMAELPLVVVDVQRAGPSTGIPTKTTQADLYHAVFGGHGNLPRVVLAPTDAADAITLAVHAFYLAEKYQLPVLLLTDQFLGQRLEVIPQVDFAALQPKVITRTLPTAEELQHYQRFKFTDSGVSPISAPGIKNGMYTAAGIEHDETGRPTSNAELDEKMTRKRALKSETIRKQEPGLLWRCGDQDPEIGILAWGSTKGVVQEAVARLQREGRKVAAMVLRQLAPLPVTPLQDFLTPLEGLLIVEMADRQFYNYLKSQLNLPHNTRVHQHLGATLFTVQEIIEAIKEVDALWETTLQQTIAAM